MGNTLHFRRLRHREEMALADAKDPLRARLAAALVEVSREGSRPFQPDAEAATRILKPITAPILERLWISYRTALPVERVFTTLDLYKAPDPQEHRTRSYAGEEEAEQAVDGQMDGIAKKFGNDAASEAERIQQTVFEDAKRRNVLVRPKE